MIVQNTLIISAAHPPVFHLNYQRWQHTLQVGYRLTRSGPWMPKGRFVALLSPVLWPLAFKYGEIMKFLFSIVISLVSTSLFAGTASGKVTQVLAHTDGGNGHGVFMFYIEGQRDNIPTCSIVGGGKAWALSLEKASGRAIYSLLLSAQAQGKAVSVVGRGNCNSWGDREEPHYINLVN